MMLFKQKQSFNLTGITINDDQDLRKVISTDVTGCEDESLMNELIP